MERGADVLFPDAGNACGRWRGYSYEQLWELPQCDHGHGQPSEHFAYPYESRPVPYIRIPILFLLCKVGGGTGPVRARFEMKPCTILHGIWQEGYFFVPVPQEAGKY